MQVRWYGVSFKSADNQEANIAVESTNPMDAVKEAMVAAKEMGEYKAEERMIELSVVELHD